jgi:hypothetical protein
MRSAFHGHARHKLVMPALVQVIQIVGISDDAAAFLGRFL